MLCVCVGGGWLGWGERKQASNKQQEGSKKGVKETSPLAVAVATGSASQSQHVYVCQSTLLFGLLINCFVCCCFCRAACVVVAASSSPSLSTYLSSIFLPSFLSISNQIQRRRKRVLERKDNRERISPYL